MESINIIVILIRLLGWGNVFWFWFLANWLNFLLFLCLFFKPIGAASFAFQNNSTYLSFYKPVKLSVFLYTHKNNWSHCVKEIFISLRVSLKWPLVYLLLRLLKFEIVNECRKWSLLLFVSKKLYLIFPLTSYCSCSNGMFRLMALEIMTFKSIYFGLIGETGHDSNSLFVRPYDYG